MPTDALSAPERNRYFYGLLMDAERFDKDQSYFNTKRHLINRLAIGAGVLCGLELEWDAKKSTLTLGAGVGIDFAGREIVVPKATSIDTAHLTDAHGKPVGPVPANSTILILLAYAQRSVDPVAVLVPDCDHPDGCAPSVIEEGYAVVVKEAVLAPIVQGCRLSGGFPLPPGGALQKAVGERVTAAQAVAPADTAIPLGRFTAPGGPLDMYAERRSIYNNTLLYDLIVCLAERVSQIAGDLLVYVSGDNQSAHANAKLAAPLVVELEDSSGNPVSGGSAPEFKVTSGGGSVGPVQTNPGGQYEATWTLGASGTQTVVAQSANSKLNVTFHATIEP